jgi:hypothetical protein
MSTTVSWNAPVSGDWNTGTDWAGGTVPLPANNASLGLAAPYTVTIAGGETETINALTIANAAATLALNGRLNLGGTLSGAGPVVLSGGTIAGGTIANGAELSFNTAYNTLAGVVVDGGLQVGGPAGSATAVLTATTTVYAADGVSPGIITLGSAAATGDLYIQNTRTITNTITAGGSGENDYIDIGGTLNGGTYAPDTLTLGPASIVQGGTGDTITFRDNGQAVGFGTLVNQGLISAGPTADTVNIATQGFTNAGLMLATGPGDTLNIETGGNRWSNTGTIAVSGGGSAYLGGTILAVGALTHSGSGNIHVTGTIVNTGATLDAAGSLNGVLIDGGRIVGGTVLDGADLAFTTGYNILDGVVVDGGLQVGGPAGSATAVLTATTTVYAADGVSPGIITLGSAAATGDLYLQNTHTIANTITAGGSGENDYIDIGGTLNGGTYAPDTLTLGPASIVQGGTGDTITFRDNGQAVGFGTLVNQGLISAGPTADTVNIATQGFTNAGLMLATGPGDTLNIENGSNTWSNTGTIAVAGGGSAYLGGTLTGTGQLLIGAHGKVEIAGATGQSATFTDHNATLQLDMPAKYTGVLTSLVSGDTIDLVGETVTGAFFSGQTLVVNGVSAYAVAGDVSGDTISIVGSDLIINGPVTCFAAGTGIDTPDGNIPVERLCIGDIVLTEDAGPKPVRWIGQRHIDCARHPGPESVRPVRIRAHAFGPGLPQRDLVLSPDHAVFAEGALIPVKYLIDGEAVTQEQRSRITYYHVELDRHAILRAEGLPVESFLDTGNRAAFANAGRVVALHPDFATPADFAARIWESAGAAPLAVTGPAVARTRARLRARAMAAQPVSAARRPAAIPLRR